MKDKFRRSYRFKIKPVNQYTMETSFAFFTFPSRESEVVDYVPEDLFTLNAILIRFVVA